MLVVLFSHWLLRWIPCHTIWYQGYDAVPACKKTGSCTGYLWFEVKSVTWWNHLSLWTGFRVCVQVFRCLHKMAPEYLSTYCQPISGRRHLRSADRGHLDFPRVKFSSYGGRSFAYAGPSNWNSLPAYLRDSSLSSFKHHLKTFLFSFYTQHVWGSFTKNALYKFTVIIHSWRSSLQSRTLNRCFMAFCYKSIVPQTV